MRSRPWTRWVEIDESAYLHNLGIFTEAVGGSCRVMAVVKANAYGHDAGLIAPLAVRGGAGALGVNSLEEGLALRRILPEIPIVILAYTLLKNLHLACNERLEPVLYNPASLVRLNEAVGPGQPPARFHLKLETGVNRQGVLEKDLPEILNLVKRLERIELHGVSMHFANIEDTTDHSFARSQIDCFRHHLATVESIMGRRPLAHAACSAAAILMRETHFDMVRIGIASYGLWPSKETYLSTILSHTEPPVLKPVLTWKTRVAQVKEIPVDSHVGYGCTFRATHPMRLAVLPIGYDDGYDRRLSGLGQVLVRGKRAPVVGRICMNMTMIDVSDIPAAEVEDEVVLLGRQGQERISADELAGLCHTIHYEIVTRISRHIPRLAVP